MFDESPTVPERIYQAFYGGLVQDKPHFCEHGNGIQSSGEFYYHGEQLPEDLVGVQYGSRLTDNTIQLESKKDMKKRGISSPALARTYAYPVPQRGNVNYWQKANTGNRLPDHITAHFDYGELL